MEKVCGVFVITNKITGERYIGASVDVYREARRHKRPSVLKKYNKMRFYRDIQELGVENFEFRLLRVCKPEELKKVKQEVMDDLRPEYNLCRAYGKDIARRKANRKTYYEKNGDKLRAYSRKWFKEYRENNKDMESERHKVWYEQHKEEQNARHRVYNNRLCLYNGETMTFINLVAKLRKAGVEHPAIEANKYVIEEK